MKIPEISTPVFSLALTGLIPALTDLSSANGGIGPRVSVSGLPRKSSQGSRMTFQLPRTASQSPVLNTIARIPGNNAGRLGNTFFVPCNCIQALGTIPRVPNTIAQTPGNSAGRLGNTFFVSCNCVQAVGTIPRVPNTIAQVPGNSTRRPGNMFQGLCGFVHVS